MIERIDWRFAGSMLAFTAALFVGHELFRRWLRATAAFFLVVAVTLPLWLHNADDWFRLAKVLSVVIPICFLNQVRLSEVAAGCDSLDEVLAAELAARIGVDDLRCAVAGNGLVERLHAEVRFHCDRDAVREHLAAVPTTGCAGL